MKVPGTIRDGSRNWSTYYGRRYPGNPVPVLEGTTGICTHTQHTHYIHVCSMNLCVSVYTNVCVVQLVCVLYTWVKTYFTCTTSQCATVVCVLRTCTTVHTHTHTQHTTVGYFYTHQWWVIIIYIIFKKSTCLFLKDIIFVCVYILFIYIITSTSHR